MNRLMKTTLAALLAVAATAASAEDFRPRPPRGPGGPGPLQELRSLDLAPEQREAIRNLRDSFRPRLDSTHDALRELDRELRAISGQETFDPAAVEPLARAKGEKVVELEMLRAELGAAVRAHLTPEQRSSLRDRGRDRELESCDCAPRHRPERGPRGNRGPRSGRGR